MGGNVMEERVQKLEDKVTDLSIRIKVAETNIETVTQSVNEIKNNTKALVWLVGGALILTVLNLIIKGGLIVP